MYIRLAALSTCSDEIYEDLKQELEDRYGKLPLETNNLFRIVALKRELIKLRISKMEKGPNNLVFSFLEDTPIAPEKLLSYLQQNSGKKKKYPPRLTPDGRLVIGAELSSIDAIFTTASKTFIELNQLID